MADQLKTVKAGEYLFLQGQPGHELYFLRSGALEVILSPSNPDLTEDDVNRQGQVIERFDQPGQLVGEISPILDCPRSASIRAAEDSTLLAADIQPGSFENVFRAKPALGIKIAEELARRINKTNERVKKHDMRLLRFLEEIRVSLSSFWNDQGAPVDMSCPECSGNIFLALAKFFSTTTALPADLPVSLALPYDQAGAFFSFFGGFAFTPSGVQTHAASAAQALSKIHGQRYVAGQVLCSSGEEARELYLLLDGKLEVVVGRRSVQTLEGRGSVIGEMAFLLKTRRTASVIAAENSSILAIPYEKMEAIFSKVPPILLLMLKQLAGRLLQIDTQLQKSTWRNIYFGELMPVFIQTMRSSMDAIPSSASEEIRGAAQKAMALIEESGTTMTKSAGSSEKPAPFTLSELIERQIAPAVTTDELSETPPGPESSREHTDFVLCLADNRKVFGPPQTPKARFAQYLNVDENSLIMGRLIGKIGRSGTYVEVLLPDEGTDDTRRKMAEQVSGALGLSHVLMTKPPLRWFYQHDVIKGAAVAADMLPHAETILQSMLTIERESVTALDCSRARRLYLESLISTLESHWSAPGKFTDLSPAEFALAQFGILDSGDVDKLKLDPIPGRTVQSIMDFAKTTVIRLAGGESAVMGDIESAKVRLPEKEKQLAGLIEARKKVYADLQVPYEDAREGPLMQQLEKLAGMVRLKETGGLTGDALRDFAATEKEMEKNLDERNSFVTQKLKGDAGRKAVSQMKACEDQIRGAIREKLDLIDTVQTPQAEADAKKQKDAPLLLPINLLNAFRDAVIDIYSDIRQASQPDNIDVLPLYQAGVRIYSGRDVGIAIQKIFEKDKLLPTGDEFPVIIRLPGEGYSVYSKAWNVLAIPMYLAVDPFQMMAHGIGLWRWSRIPESECRKFQKAFKGGSSIKLDQLGIFFARDYRMLLDDQDVDEGSTKFIRSVMAASSAPAPAKGK